MTLNFFCTHKVVLSERLFKFIENLCLLPLNQVQSFSDINRHHLAGTAGYFILNNNTHGLFLSMIISLGECEFISNCDQNPLNFCVQKVTNMTDTVPNGKEIYLRQR